MMLLMVPSQPSLSLESMLSIPWRYVYLTVCMAAHHLVLWQHTT